MKLFNQILTTAIISYVFFTMGILYVLPSSTHKLFKSENTTLNRIMTETELSFMGSISSASTLIVTPFCGHLLDSLGRKGSLILFYVPQLIGWGLIATIFRIEAFIFSMFLCGLSGSIFLIAPVYMSEYCDPCFRGVMTSSSLISYGVGLMMSYLLGGLLNYNTMTYTGLAMAIVGLVLICFIRESPLYLMKRGFEAVNSTPQEQKLNPGEYKPRQKIPIWKYFAKSLSSRRALVILLVVYTSCLFQGEVVFEMYAKPLLEESVPNMTVTLSSVMFGIINVFAGLFGAYLMDTVGRRRLLIVSSAATGLLCVILGTHMQFRWGSNWLSAILLYLYSITYSVGPKYIPIVLMSEVFLPEVKGFATMMCIEWAFMCMFIIKFIFNPLFNAYGLCPLFYLFSGFSFFTAIFSYIYLPETKGLPVDVIQQKFLKM